MIENCISGYLYNELFSKINEEKCTDSQNITGPLLFIKIRLKTAQLFSKHFPFDLSLCILYFIFHKRSDTSAIPQPSFQDLVYVSSIFFGFHKCFNNFYWSKNVFINKFFDWIICFFIVLFPWHKGIAGFSLK